MKYTYLLLLAWLCLFQSAFAQTMKSINIEGGDNLINQSININIEFTSDKKPWCGLRVDWGNGKSQPVRVGHDGDEGAPSSPIRLSNVYNAPGKYNISLKGELLIRGLTGTATPCEVKVAPAEVLVVDPETDTKYIEKSWTSYLGALPPLHLQCMQVGLAASDIKYEAAAEGDKLVSMNAPGSKRVMERCQTFTKAIHPKPNVACRVKGDMGLQESVCDQVYGQKMDDGNFRTLTVEETIKLHIQSKPWILGQRETPAGKENRLANEIMLREKEKQRILDAATSERTLIKEQWINYLAKINPLQLKCMQIGISDLDIKYESINDSDKLTSLTAPAAKQLTDRCGVFAASVHPKSNIACKINRGGGTQESKCDGYYAEKQQDGTFNKITLEEAARAQIQGKSWVVAQEENLAGKQVRLASEAAMREREKQRALMLEEENERLRAEQERQRTEAEKAKSAAEQEIRKTWKESGFTESRRPPCLDSGIRDYCFGVFFNGDGFRYIGEFKNNMFDGLGIFSEPNKFSYLGQFTAGMMQGEGIMLFNGGELKGRKYIGEFKNGELILGVKYELDNGVTESGLFEDGQLRKFQFVDIVAMNSIPKKYIPITAKALRQEIEIRAKKWNLEKTRIAEETTAAQIARQKEEEKANLRFQREQEERIATAKSQPKSSVQNGSSSNGSSTSRWRAVTECGVVFMGAGYFTKNTGNPAEGDKLLKWGVTWGKTAIAIGQIEGVRGETVVAETKRLSDAAGANEGSFLATLGEKMQNCLTLLKSDTQMQSMWQLLQNQ